jgi:hypothetical protein
MDREIYFDDAIIQQILEQLYIITNTVDSLIRVMYINKQYYRCVQYVLHHHLKLRHPYNDRDYHVNRFLKRLRPDDNTDYCLHQVIQFDPHRMLYFGASNGSMYLTRYALKQKIYVECLDLSLRFACQYGDMAIIDEIIKKGTLNFNEGLYGACMCSRTGIIQYMIKKGANDYCGALRYACMSGDLDLFKYIYAKCVQDGAQPNIYNDCLSTACECGYMEIIKLLLPHATALQQSFYEACTFGNVEIISLLIQTINHNLANQQGVLPVGLAHDNHQDILSSGLEGACENGNLSIVKLLMQSGRLI